jgi:circadian clock protein KaiB
VSGFRLYIAGTSDLSTRAIRNARALCEAHFGGAAALEIIDIFQQPRRARTDQILAVPTLVRHAPLPIIRFIGDLSNRAKLLAGLGIANE